MNEAKSLILEKIEERTFEQQIVQLMSLMPIDSFKNKYLSLVAEVSHKKIEEISIAEEFINIKKAYKEMIKKAYKEMRNGIEKENLIAEYFPTPKQFDFKLDNIQTETSRTASKLPVLPNNPIYVIILSFLSKFDAKQCNALLTSAGQPSLHGKSRVDSIFMYALNHKISYDRCVLDYIKQYDTATMNVELVRSFVALKSLAQELEQESNQTVQYTVQMTNAAQELQSKEELKTYLAENAENFRNARITPVRYLCKWILKYLEAEGKDPAQYDSVRYYNRTIKDIFYAFHAFYLNYTRYPLKRFAGELFVELWGNVGGADKDPKNNYLRKALSGEIELKRKFFVLLYIFFHQKAWELPALDKVLTDCGFDSIEKDFNTMEDVFIAELNRYKAPEDRAAFMTQYMVILFYSKNYSELSDLEQRVLDKEDWQKKYKSICENIGYFYGKLMYGKVFEKSWDTGGFIYVEYVDEQKESLVGYIVSLLTQQLDRVYRASNRALDHPKELGKEKLEEAKKADERFLESLNAMLSDIEKIVESLLQAQEETVIPQLKLILSRLNEFVKMNNLVLQEKRQDPSIYIENPLYLNPKIDV